MKRTNTHSDAFLSCIHTDGRIDWPRERGGERDKETRRQGDKETTPSEPEPKDHVVGDLEKAESFARFLVRFQTFFFGRPGIHARAGKFVQAIVAAILEKLLNKMLLSLILLKASLLQVYLLQAPHGAAPCQFRMFA